MKIICFSLWGDNKKYTYGAVENAKLAKMIYPGWKCLFYVGQDVPGDIIYDIIKNDGNVINMKTRKPDCQSGAFWRLLGMGENVTHYISRDTDSRLSWREKHAVDEWISSGKKFHIMKDHFCHMKNSIMAGMFGCVGGIFSNISDMIENYISDRDMKYLDDQIFLSKKVYPIIKDDVMIHDLNSKWPTDRDGLDHVGSIYNHNNVRITNFVGI